MVGRDKIGFWDSLFSLGAFATQGYQWVLSGIAVGGPLFLMWESVQIAAQTHGWWVYPFVLAASFLAFFGLIMFAFYLSGKVRLLTRLDNLRDEEKESVLALADRAISLARELYSLVGEHQSHPPTLPDFAGPDGTNKWQLTNIKQNQTMVRKYHEKFATQVVGVLTMARRYLPDEKFQHMIWRTQHINGYEIADIANSMVEIGVRLHESMKVSEGKTLPSLPPAKRDGELDL